MTLYLKYQLEIERIRNWKLSSKKIWRYGKSNTYIHGKWAGEDCTGPALFISFKSCSTRKHRDILPIAFLSTHCVWILVPWKAICRYQLFDFPSSRWLMVKGRNLEFIILNHLLPKWILRLCCRSIMIRHCRQRAIYFDLRRCSRYDICWNDFLKKEIIFRLNILESQPNLFGNPFHLCLADHVLSFHIFTFLSF